MKKTLLLTFFILNSFLFSSELLTYRKGNKNYSYCIEDYYIKNNRIYFNKSGNTNYNYEVFTNIKTYQILSGYIFTNNKCIKSDLNTSSYTSVSSSELNHKNLSFLGLSNQDLNYMFALSGTLSAFIFLFGLFRWI